MFTTRMLVLGGVAVVAVAMLGIVMASTASNSVPDSKAGEGQGTITGYDISTVHYELNEIDPSKIDAVTFKLDSAPTNGSTIKVKLGSTSSSWYTCTTASTSATCSTTAPAASVASANELKVVVAQ